ncbi:MAG: hypothetical protein ABFC38_07225 [Methanospirillum sp.]
MRGEDGGIDVLTEDRTYTLAAGSLRSLLFLGNRVRLSGGDAAAWPGRTVLPAVTRSAGRWKTASKGGRQGGGQCADRVCSRSPRCDTRRGD